MKATPKDHPVTLPPVAIEVPSRSVHGCAQERGSDLVWQEGLQGWV